MYDYQLKYKKGFVDDVAVGASIGEVHHCQRRPVDDENCNAHSLYEFDQAWWYFVACILDLGPLNIIRRPRLPGHSYKTDCSCLLYCCNEWL